MAADFLYLPFRKSRARRRVKPIQRVSVKRAALRPIFWDKITQNLNILLSEWINLQQKYLKLFKNSQFVFYQVY